MQPSPAGSSLWLLLHTHDSEVDLGGTGEQPACKRDGFHHLSGYLSDLGNEELLLVLASPTELAARGLSLVVELQMCALVWETMAARAAAWCKCAWKAFSQHLTGL